jgi:hypothetical protein
MISPFLHHTSLRSSPNPVIPMDSSVPGFV